MLRSFFISFWAVAALLVSLSLACGGRSINKKTAHGVIVNTQETLFDKEDVDILSTSQTGSDSAVVEAEVRTAFALKKVNGEWVIQDVRVGKHQWEKLEDILLALGEIKSEATRDLLDQVMASIEKYREVQGSLPVFEDYVSLSDKLNPGYMTPLIRLDAWRNPLFAARSGPRTIQLKSAGPDGRLGTEDDIELSRTFPP